MRESVKWFAGIMEQTLQKHDENKGSDGWLSCDVLSMFEDLKKEVDELEKLIIKYDYVKSEELLIIKECADIANFAMMIADIVR